MFDALKDQDVTEAAFQVCLDSCDFEPGSHEEILRAELANNVFYMPDDYLAFLRFMQESQGTGNAADCECGCDSEIELEDFAGTGCVITNMGNCIWRFTQATPTIIGSATVYYYSFRDIMGQCLRVENSDDPSKPTTGVGLDTHVVFCDGSTYDGVGGFSGSDSQIRTTHWSQADVVTYYKITLVP